MTCAALQSRDHPLPAALVLTRSCENSCHVQCMQKRNRRAACMFVGWIHKFFNNEIPNSKLRLFVFPCIKVWERLTVNKPKEWSPKITGSKERVGRETGCEVASCTVWQCCLTRQSLKTGKEGASGQPCVRGTILTEFIGMGRPHPLWAAPPPLGFWIVWPGKELNRDVYSLLCFFCLLVGLFVWLIFAYGCNVTAALIYQSRWTVPWL